MPGGGCTREKMARVAIIMIRGWLFAGLCCLQSVQSLSVSVVKSVSKPAGESVSQCVLNICQEISSSPAECDITVANLTLFNLLTFQYRCTHMEFQD